MSAIFLILLSTITVFYGDSLNKHTKFEAIEYSLSTPGNTIKIEDEDSNTQIEYTPEVGTHAGLTLTKYGYSLGLSFLDPLNKDELEKGKKRSKYFDIRFKKPYENQLWEVYYQHYSGFKLKNQDITTTELLDIETINYGVHVNYYLSNDFIAIENIGQFSLNRKTFWSTLVGLGLSQNFLQSKDTLIPSELETTLDEYKGLKGIRKNSLSLEYGITGQYVFKKFFIQGLLAIGINAGKVHYSGSKLKDSFKSGPSSLFNLSLGHEFKSSLFGVQLSDYSISDQQNDEKFSSGTSELLIYYKFFF